MLHIGRETQKSWRKLTFLNNTFFGGKNKEKNGETVKTVKTAKRPSSYEGSPVGNLVSLVPRVLVQHTIISTPLVYDSIIMVLYQQCSCLCQLGVQHRFVAGADGVSCQDPSSRPVHLASPR